MNTRTSAPPQGKLENITTTNDLTVRGEEHPWKMDEFAQLVRKSFPDEGALESSVSEALGRTLTLSSRSIPKFGRLTSFLADSYSFPSSTARRGFTAS